MAVGMIGRKCGMTRVFDEKGRATPVTVLHVEPNRVVETRTYHEGTDRARHTVQITAGAINPAKLTKAQAGHFRKASVEPGRVLREFDVQTAELEAYPVGHTITVEDFQEGQYIDVTGTSKGKGFAGAVKRHNFKTQDATHGNSLSHRAPGSIGQCQTPGRVFKGKKMAGHMGAERCTMQNVQVVKIDSEKNLIMVKGGIPGAPGGFLKIKPAVKKPAAVSEG